MKNFTKKATAINIAVMVVISLLSGFIVSDFVFTSSEVVTSTSDDLACKTFINSQDNAASSLIIFLTNLKLKCKTEKIGLDGDTEKEDLTKLANTMAKCWDRYGSGELDFLGKFGTEGNWCFTCAELTFDDKTKYYDYTQTIVPWLKKNDIKLANGSESSYYDYLNLNYFNGNDQTLSTIESGISEIEGYIEDGDPTLTSLVTSMSEKNLELIDLAQKSIDGNQNNFIVYRYNRIPKETYDIVVDVAIGFTAGFVLESILFWGVGAIITVGTLGTAGPVVAAVGTYRTGKSYKKSQRLEKAYLAAQKLIASTKDTIKFSKPSKVLNTINKFDGNIKSAYKIGDKLNKIDPDFAQFYLKVGKTLESLGIKNVKDIQGLIDSKNLNLGKIVELERLIITGKKIDVSKFDELGDIQSNLNTIKQLTDLQSELKTADKLTDLSKAGDLATVDKIFKYSRLMLKLSSGLIGGSIAGTYNSNNVQYVDILNKEQYYRLCGTEPIITK